MAVFLTAWWVWGRDLNETFTLIPSLNAHWEASLPRTVHSGADRAFWGVSCVGISFHCQQWDLSELQLLHLYDGSSTGPTSERCHEAWGG